MEMTFAPAISTAAIERFDLFSSPMSAYCGNATLTHPRPRPFWDHVSLEELAAAQGIGPLRRLEDLRGDFWPEDDDVDEFLRSIRSDR